MNNNCNEVPIWDTLILKIGLTGIVGHRASSLVQIILVCVKILPQCEVKPMKVNRRKGSARKHAKHFPDEKRHRILNEALGVLRSEVGVCS